MISEQLLTSFLQSNSLSALVETASILFDAPVIVVDEAFRIAAGFASNGHDYKEYRTAVRHGQLSFEAASKISEKSEKISKDYFCFEQNNKNYYAATLHTGEVMTGYMILLSENQGVEKIPESDLVFAAALVSKQLCLEKHQSASNTVEQLLITLLNGEFTDEEHFRLSAASTFLPNFKPHFFALVDAAGEENLNAPDDMLQRSLESSFHGSYPFFYRGRIIMFIHEDHDLKYLEDFAKNKNLCIVVSPKLDSVFAAAGIYKTVSRVMDYLLLKGRKGILEHSQKYAVLMALKGIEDPDTVILPEIKDMWEYDEKNSSELCLTMYFYLVCHHSLIETCERLYAHRNTVLYRMKKMKEDFGLSPELAENHISYLISCALLLLKDGNDDLFIL